MDYHRKLGDLGLNFLRSILLLSMLTAVSACGRLEPIKMTAERLGAGYPDLYEATLPFDSAVGSHDLESYPILNSGFRTATITAITFSDSQYTLDATSECAIGSEIKAGESCDIAVKFTPLGPGNADAIMTIEYDGNQGPYSSDYPLQGVTH